MKEELDIHHYGEKLKRSIEILRNTNLSERNKEIIMKFYEYGLMNGLSKARILKYFEILRIYANIIKKDFDAAGREDIEKFVRHIEEQDFSAWTKYTYKIIIKRFYKWLKGNDEIYPDEVKWLKPVLKRTDTKLPEEGDLVNEEDIKKLIDTAEHPRNKALISSLYESGCRIGEIASLQLKNVQFDEFGTVIFVQGKTGSRKIRLVSSTPFLATWIQNHPFKENKEAPLWVNIGTKNHNKPLEYGAIRTYLKKLFIRVKINKRSNPHSFRHARATFLANHLTEFQMNQYFGWIQGSDMPAVYVHLSGKETDGAILELNGMKTNKEHRESLLKPKKCPRCDTINSHQSKFCSKCGGVLDINTAIELEDARKEEKEVRSEADNIMNALMKDPEIREFLLKKIKEKNLT